MIKKRILLVWWYDRIDLISPFIKMQEDIEFTCLFYRYKEQENLNFEMPFRRIYWTDFTSPNQILEQVNPEKVIFFGSGNLLTFSLIFACKLKKIRTYFLSHGLQPKDVEFRVSEFETYENSNIKEEIDERYNPLNKSYQKEKYHTLFFYLRSLLFINSYKYIFDFCKIFYYSIFDKNEIRRLINTRNTFRIFDKYLLFCRNDFNYFKKQDNITEVKVEYIGPYTLDNLFDKDVSETNKIIYKNIKYAIFIDQAITTYPTKTKNILLKKLSKFLYSNNTLLYIKLHPLDYNNEQYYKDENIVLVKNNDNIEELISNSIGCYGFYSAMLLPILLRKKTICFDLGIATDVTDEWLNYKMIKLVNSNDFEAEDINFDLYDNSNRMKDEFIYNCLTYTDGKCTERLHQLLLA